MALYLGSNKVGINYLEKPEGGYAEGYAKGEADGYEKGHTEGLTEGIEQGEKAEYDRFWDDYQYKGTRTAYAFSFGGWTREAFTPKYSMAPENASYMFAKMATPDANTWSLVELLERCGVTLDTSNCDNHTYMFFENIYVAEIPHIDLSKSDYATNLFYFCFSLKKVSITVAPNTVPNTSGWFHRCDALEDLTINGTLDKSLSLQHSSKLTDASVQSVIDCLKDLTGATAQTLTFHKDVGNKLTQAQKDAISAKNWTLAY
jgi:hypothetical protein